MAEESIARHIREAIEEITDFDAAELTEIGNAALTIITLRTRAGMDADRIPFEKYSDSYKVVRASKSLSTSTVDLARTGHMIGSMIPVPDTGRGEVVIRFMSANEERKATFHTEGTRNRGFKRLVETFRKRSIKGGAVRMPKRDFFDVRDPKDIDFVLDACGRILDGRIEKVRK